MNYGTLLLLPLASLALTSCGETKREVIERYKSRFGELREELKKIAEEVPGAPDTLNATLPLDPVPKYKENAPGSNTTILMHAQLLDPDVELRVQRKLDLMLSSGFDSHLAWTGEKSSMSDSVLDDSAGKMEVDLKGSLGVRYIGIVRVLRYVEPSVITAESFVGGRAELGVHLWDRDQKKLLSSSTVSAQSDDQVRFSFGPGEDRKESLEKFARSTLYTNARKMVLKELAEKTGGTFTGR